MSALTERISDLGQAILLACMNRNELFYFAKKRIKTDDFATKQERDVWDKMVSLDSQQKRFDVDAVCNPTYSDSIDFNAVARWNSRDDFYDCQPEYFEDRCNDFVNMVDRERLSQKCYKLASEIMDGVVKDSQEAGEMLNDLSSRAYQMHPVHTEFDMAERLDDAISELQFINKYGEEFGIRSLSDKLGKMAAGQVVVVAARPAIGKSAIVLSAVENFCKKGKTVVINTLEMSESEVILRLLAKESNVTMNKILGKDLMNEVEWQSLSKAKEEFKKWKLRIRDSGLRTVSDIDSYLTMRTANHEHVDLFAVDHFGLLEPEGRTTGNRATDYKKISNELKRLAKKHKCVMMILAQLNREVEVTDRPTMRNLADTSALEQDADKAIGLYRDASDDKIINVTALKNRQGEYFDIKLKFYPSTMRFYDERY